MIADDLATRGPLRVMARMTTCHLCGRWIDAITSSTRQLAMWLGETVIPRQTA